MGMVDGLVSATSVTDIMYILRKHIEPSGVREAVRTLLMVVDVADVLKNDISSAFLSDINDFEDAVQSSCAERIKAEYIVTHNLKDFDKSSIPAILPSEALSKIRNQRHLRFIDRRLDESEKLAESPDVEWISEDDFWVETEGSL